MTGRRIEYVALRSLVPADRNPKGHNIGGIVESLRRFGVVEHIGAVDGRTGKLVGGHGRTEALSNMRDAGQEPPEGVIVDTSIETEPGWDWMVPVIVGWESKDDTEAAAALLALNQHTIAGGWDDAELNVMLAELQLAEFPLDALGFTDWTFATAAPDPVAQDPEADAGASEEPTRGTLLSLLSITVAEPRHQVERGEVWTLGAHTLFVADVARDHAAWASALGGEGVLFLPYPGPFVTLSEHAGNHQMVLVQPDKYLAGHLLDKHADVHGAESVVRVS